MFFNIVHAATLAIILVLIGVGACASSGPPPQGTPAPGKTVTTRGEPAVRNPSAVSPPASDHKPEEEHPGIELANRVFTKYGEEPCWRAQFRHSSYPHRSQGSFLVSKESSLTWHMEGREPASYSLLDKKTFHQLLFLVKARKGDFTYRATAFTEPQSDQGYRFSSILDATPTTRDAGVLHARFLLDDEFRVVGAKLTFDSEGRTSTTRFWDWKGGCPL